MVEKWKLTITQDRKYSFNESTYEESVIMTHNRIEKLIDVVNYMNNTFPEIFQYKVESLDEEAEDE